MRFFDQKDNPHAFTSVTDYRQKAKLRLPSLLFDFLEGGSFDEVTIKSNSDDLETVLKLK